MHFITEAAASLKLWQYILIYIGVFILAVITASVGGSGSKAARESVIAVLALFGGMLAVGYVTIRLGKNPGLLIIVIAAVFAGIIGYPAAMISSRVPDAPKKNNGAMKPAGGEKAGKVKSIKPDDKAAALAQKAEKLTLKDIDNITDEALLCAFVRRMKSSSLSFPALKKITSDEELEKVAMDEMVDRKLRMYALEHIQSDDFKAKLVREHQGEWIGTEAKYHIKSQKLRFELFKEMPGIYSLNQNADIMKYVLENHMVPDDGVDMFPNALSRETHKKGEFYLGVLWSGNSELISMLDRGECEKLAASCMRAVNTDDAKTALDYLKLIYHAGVCESMNAEIEALDGKTFNRYDRVNYYGEREQSPGVVFDLHNRGKNK